MQKSCTQVPFLKLNSFPWKTPLSFSNACVYLVGKVPITVTATMNAIYIHCFNTRKETYPSPDICPLRELTKFQLINLIWSQFNSAWPKISAYCSKTCNHLTVYCNRWLSGLVLSIRAHSDEDKRTARILYEKIKKLFCTQPSEMVSNRREQGLLCGWAVTIKSLETDEK